MEKYEDDIIKEYVKKHKLGADTEAFAKLVNAQLFKVVFFLKTLEYSTNTLGMVDRRVVKDTTAILIAAILCNISKNRDEMFEIYNSVGEGLKALDGIISKDEK